jgi:hypothetical protein
MRKPPSIGWWPTGGHSLSWWDGRHWSWPCLDTDSMKTVARYSSKIDTAKNIKWYPRPDSWPERSKT